MDLPGWINAPTGSQTEAEVASIRKLIMEYMQQHGTVILAVMSAKSDIGLQSIVQECKKVDANGQRTLGIITKLDTVPVGSGPEKFWIDVASNKKWKLKLGWHVLRNR